MTVFAALAARVTAALVFALAVAFAAITAPAWALVLIAVAGAGVWMAAGPREFLVNPADARGFALGLACVLIATAVFGGAIGLAVLVMWRAAVEAIAAETMLRDLARRLPPDTLDRGPIRAAHLAAGPVFAVIMLFSVHGGAVLGQTTVQLSFDVAIVLVCLCLVAWIDWLVRRLAEWRMGVASRALTLHVGAHHLLFIAIGVAGKDGAALLLGLVAWRILRFAPPLPGLETASTRVRVFRTSAKKTSAPQTGKAVAR